MALTDTCEVAGYGSGSPKIGSLGRKLVGAPGIKTDEFRSQSLHKRLLA